MRRTIITFILMGVSVLGHAQKGISIEEVKEKASTFFSQQQPKEAYKLVDNYYSSLNNSDKLKEENWFIFEQYIHDVKDDPKLKFLLDNRTNFYDKCDKTLVDKKICNTLRGEISPYLSGYKVENDTDNSTDLSFVKGLIDNLNNDFEYKSALISYYNIGLSRYTCDKESNSDYVDLLKTVKKEFKNLGQPDSFLVLLNLSFLSNKGSDKARRLAAPLFEDYFKRYASETREFSLGILKNTQGAIAIIKRGDRIVFEEDMSFADAMALAKKKDKLIFIDCYTVWCGPCKKLDAETFHAVKVKKFFDKNFINLKIDMEKGEGVDLMKKFKVNSFPTTLLVDSNGDVVFRTTGFRNANEFLAIFTKALDDYKTK